MSDPFQSLRTEALPGAWTALSHLDVRVHTDFFGDVEGIDSVYLALRALAPALAQLFEDAADGPVRDDIEDVVAFLVAKGLLGNDAKIALSDVLSGVKSATYQGGGAIDVGDLEAARSQLYDCFNLLLVDAGKHAPHD